MFEYAFLDHDLSTIGKRLKDSRGIGPSDPHPNDVRRVWEAFVHLITGDNLTKAARSELVTNHIQKTNSEAALFSQAYLGNVYVNQDSHAKSKVSNLNVLLTEALQPEHFQRYVKQTILMMHLISPIHVPARLSGKEEDRAAIASYLDEQIEEELAALNWASGHSTGDSN